MLHVVCHLLMAEITQMANNSQDSKPGLLDFKIQSCSYYFKEAPGHKCRTKASSGVGEENM